MAMSSKNNIKKELLFMLYFPKCPIKGSCAPQEMHHLSSRFLVPEKCISCRMFSEGDCLRCAIISETSPSKLNNFHPMALDFGSCGVRDIPKATRVTIVRFGQSRDVWVPVKCANCDFFSNSGECSRFVEQFGLPCTLDFGGIPEPQRVQEVGGDSMR